MLPQGNALAFPLGKRLEDRNDGRKRFATIDVWMQQSKSKPVSLLQLQQLLGLPLIEIWLLSTAWRTGAVSVGDWQRDY